MNINIWTDGSCHGNPGPAGSGAVLESGQYRKEISKPIGVATNNIAEMSAVILALEALTKPAESDVTLHTDSQLVKGLLAHGWKAHTNIGLANHMQALAGRLKSLKVVHISAHAGDPNNERADRLANQAADKAAE